MGATKRKYSPFVMVKQRRLPLRGIVTPDAMGDVPLSKLLTVNVLVAVFALRWRSLEIHIEHLGFEIGRLMAVNAGRCAMRPQQWEFRFRVVETRDFPPRLRGVACFASGH